MLLLAGSAAHLPQNIGLVLLLCPAGPYLSPVKRKPTIPFPSKVNSRRIGFFLHLTYLLGTTFELWGSTKQDRGWADVAVVRIPQYGCTRAQD